MTGAPQPRLYVIWGLLLAIDVAIQLAMKIAGDELNAIPFGFKWAAVALSTEMVWISLVGYVATFVLWLAILYSSPLSAAFPLTALTYVLVPLCGWILLGEQINAGHMAGIALIVVGVIFQRDASQAD